MSNLLKNIVIVTGSAGLIGSESVRFFSRKGFDVLGIDNDMRSYFFGHDATTNWNLKLLEKETNNYTHFNIDIRDLDSIEKIFKRYDNSISGIIHAAAQPSHDWAVKEPFTDFSVNALGTLNLLEMTRRYCSDAVFIFTSSNKVYGDNPNSLPLVELDFRWELQDHVFAQYGIDESMSIDQTKHSLFGSSKLSADILVQEYGNYFGMKTGVFRGGCLTGPAHSGTELHGFLSYLAKCAVFKKPYNVFGHKGKQVRDNIHSHDLVQMFWHFFKNPHSGEVYNVGGSRHSNCSLLEAISLCEKLTGIEMDVTFLSDNRIGDHIWWVSDIRKFQNHYPDWKYSYNLEEMLSEILDVLISDNERCISDH